MSETITVTAKRNFVPPDNACYVVCNKKIYSMFNGFQINRGLEQIPGSFSINLPCDHSTFPEIEAMDEIDIYINKQQLFSGYVEIISKAASGNDHSYVIAGRSKIKDLVDSMPEIGGTSIENVQSLGDICAVFCPLFGLGYIDKSTSGSKTAWDSIPFNLGDTCMSVILRYAQYQGKLIYENGYSSLIINDVSTKSVGTINASSPVIGCSSTYDYTSRFARYDVFWAPMTTQSQTGLPPVQSASDPQADLFNPNRRKVIINSTSDEDGTIAQRLATWNANRAFGRSLVVTIDLAGWVNGISKLWDVNQLVSVNLPEISVNTDMIVAAVSYSYGPSGSTSHLTLYPKEAFSFEPVTLYTASPALQSLPENN